jgi:hypothetical protein
MLDARRLPAALKAARACVPEAMPYGGKRVPPQAVPTAAGAVFQVGFLFPAVMLFPRLPLHGRRAPVAPRPSRPGGSGSGKHFGGGVNPPGLAVELLQPAAAPTLGAQGLPSGPSHGYGLPPWRGLLQRRQSGRHGAVDLEGHRAGWPTLEDGRGALRIPRFYSRQAAGSRPIGRSQRNAD